MSVINLVFNKNLNIKPFKIVSSKAFTSIISQILKASPVERVLILLFPAFPTVFSSSVVHHELVANYSHLFRVQGSQPDLVPYLLLAHIDVVPAKESDGWEAPPFSAEEIDDFIYGRGTIDDKCSVMVGEHVMIYCENILKLHH